MDSICASVRARPLASTSLPWLSLSGPAKGRSLPAAISVYIVGAYWFTASTSFANPAVTIARALSNTFAGIAPADAPAFIVAQMAGALLAWLTAHYLDR